MFSRKDRYQEMINEINAVEDALLLGLYLLLGIPTGICVVTLGWLLIWF